MTKKNIDWSKYNNSEIGGVVQIGGNHPDRSRVIDQRLADLLETVDSPMSLGEIAKAVGVSKSAIQQIEMKAMKNLRKKAQTIIKEWQDS